MKWSIIYLLMVVLLVTSITARELIINGDAETGDITNWNVFDGVTINDPFSGTYSFNQTGPSTSFSNQYFYIINGTPYNQSGWFRANGTSANTRLYYGYRPFDENKIQIQNHEVHPILNTNTTTLETFVSTAKVINLTSCDNWYNLSHNRIAFNTELDYSDLPNRNTSSIRFNITDMGSYCELTFPTTVGVAAPSGTNVRQHIGGGTYMYSSASNVKLANDTFQYQSSIISLVNDRDGSPPIGSKWWVGTKFVQFMFLLNHAGSEADMTIFDNLSLETEYPTIELDLIYPNFGSDDYLQNVSQNQFFNVTVNVTCRNNDCGEINVSLDPIDLTPQQCNVDGSSSSTGIDCFGQNEDATDATSDNCVDGSTVDSFMWNEDIYLDKTAITTTDVINVTCETCCYSTATQWGIAYNNGTGFTLLDTGNCAGGSGVQACTFLENHSYEIEVDDIIGDHTVRCIQKWSSLVVNTCEIGTHDDNDDMNFTVLPGKGGLVSDNIGDLSFYTNESNPRNVSLNQDESATLVFYVNATGFKGLYQFFAFANLTADESVSNITNDWNVSIVTKPTITIVYPVDGTTYYTHNLSINYTIETSGQPTDMCWYGIQNDNPYDEKAGDITSTFDSGINCIGGPSIDDGSNDKHIGKYLLIKNNTGSTKGNCSYISDSFAFGSCWTGGIGCVCNLVELVADVNIGDSFEIWDTKLECESARLEFVNTTLDNCDNVSIDLTTANYNLTVYANDTWGNVGEKTNYFEVDATTLTITRIYPSIGTELINVSPNQWFNITLEVTCNVDNCGDVNVSLDPPAQDYVWQDAGAGGISGPNGWNWMMGYNFTPDYDMWVTELCNYADGTKTTKLYDSDIVEIAAESIGPGNGAWECVELVQPILISSDEHYYVVTCLQGSGGYSQSSAGMPRTINNVRVTHSQFFSTSGCVFSTANVQLTTMYGLSDIGVRDSIGQKFGLIPTSFDPWLPFWTNKSSNPFTITLNRSQSKEITFYVNGSGTLGLNTFFAFANKTIHPSVSDISTDWNVSLTTCYPPNKGNWEIRNNCTHQINKIVPANVTIYNQTTQVFINNTYWLFDHTYTVRKEPLSSLVFQTGGFRKI